MFNAIYHHQLLAGLGGAVVVMLGIAAVLAVPFSLSKLPESWRHVVWIQLGGFLSAFCFFLAGGFLAIHGYEGWFHSAVTDRVEAKYGSQITKVGDTNPDADVLASTWVIDGEKRTCTLNTTDFEDPIVSCGDELPIPEAQ